LHEDSLTTRNYFENSGVPSFLNYLSKLYLGKSWNPTQLRAPYKLIIFGLLMYNYSMRYLVFGGAGYLGSHLVEQLLLEKHEIFIFDNYSGSLNTNFGKKVHQIEGDITNFQSLEQIDDYGLFDGVFHLAAKKSVSESFLYPEEYRKVNEYGTKNLVDYCLTRKISNFVFTSSAAIYGDVNSNAPLGENFSTKPMNPYGQSKLNSEVMLSNLFGEQNFKSVSLRIFNIVGASKKEFLEPYGQNVLPMIVDKLKKRETFTIFGDSYLTEDGTCVRDYVNVKDVANAHVLAMKYLVSGKALNSHESMNISSGVGISVQELIRKVEFFSGQRLRFTVGQSRLGDPAIVIGSNGLAMQKLGWDPVSGIDKSIVEMLGLS
jgi:UDP-glucose 4-epimerase